MSDLVIGADESPDRLILRAKEFDADADKRAETAQAAYEDAQLDFLHRKWMVGEFLSVARDRTAHGHWLTTLARAGFDHQRAGELVRFREAHPSVDALEPMSWRDAIASLPKDPKVSEDTESQTADASAVSEPEPEGPVEPDEVIPPGDTPESDDGGLVALSEAEELRSELAAAEAARSEAEAEAARQQARAEAVEAEAGDVQAGVAAQRRVDELKDLTVKFNRSQAEVGELREENRKQAAMLHKVGKDRDRLADLVARCEAEHGPLTVREAETAEAMAAIAEAESIEAQGMADEWTDEWTDEGAQW
ncbi:MAG: hypothetical protein OXC29_13460 [Rhodococcus sp.]|nr:hypothetical protein [Rhodococcus sp. (in: high G+C Gram-positive bacteria)]